MGKFAVVLVSACLAALLAPGCLRAASPDADPSLVEKGRYLATAGDCTSCHVDPKTGSPYAGGYGVGSPLGTIYGSNITPSTNTGIGNWTLAQFSDAVRKGKRADGANLYPAMPYTAFSGIADDDIKALYSYFMLGVPAVENQAPRTALSFPYNMRWLMKIWDAMFGGSGGKPASVAPLAGVERGKYLVETLAHCSTCHTPRGFLMNEESGKFLAGGKVGSWNAPNITSDPVSGIGNWSEDEIATFLKIGVVHGKAIAAGEMGLAVQNSFSKMTDGDLRSIAAYIRTVPAKPGSDKTPRSGGTRSAPMPITKLESPLDTRDYKAFMTVAGMSGAQIYDGACATCHGYDGRGTPDRVLPPLVGSSAVGAADPSNLVMTIASGVDRKVGTDHAFMPAFRNQLNEDQLAAVADYVSTSFGSPDHRVTSSDVAKIYNSTGGASWLIRHAGALIWIGLAVVVIAVIAWIAKRRRRRVPMR